MAIKKAIPFAGKLKIKTGDNVIVIAGKDKGKTGTVSKTDPSTGKVIVDGLNIVTKHQKARPTQTDPNPESGRVQVAAPILASKVALVNGEGKATRIRIKTDENGVKSRVAVKGGTTIEEPKRSK